MAHDLSRAAVVEAIARNLKVLWRHIGLLPGAELEDAAGRLSVATGLPFSFFNAVIDGQLTPQKVDTEIDVALQLFVRRRVPMVWLVTPNPQPADLGRRLMAHGLQDLGDEPGMALGLQLLPAELPTPAGFAVERVDNLEALTAWCSFAGEPAVREALVAWGRAIGFAPDRMVAHYLGRLDGRPVATATLVLGGEAAGIYNVMTIPEVQRQGIGALMTTIPLRAARARGYRLGVLKSSTVGLRLYQRLGFQEYCRIGRYAWHASGAPALPNG